MLFMGDLNDEQKKGLEDFEKEFQERIKRVASQHGDSEARQKAKAFVQARKDRIEYIKKWGNNG